MEELASPGSFNQFCERRTLDSSSAGTLALYSSALESYRKAITGQALVDVEELHDQPNLIDTAPTELADFSS